MRRGTTLPRPARLTQPPPNKKSMTRSLRTQSCNKRTESPTASRDFRQHIGHHGLGLTPKVAQMTPLMPIRSPEKRGPLIPDFGKLPEGIKNALKGTKSTNWRKKSPNRHKKAQEAPNMPPYWSQGCFRGVYHSHD